MKQKKFSSGMMGVGRFYNAKPITENPFLVLLIFFLTTLVLRFLTFSPSVIDHDESSYLIIAREMLRGSILYVDFWDTKPIGIFLIFAFFQKLFFFEIWGIRLAGVIAISITAFILYKAKRKQINSSIPFWVGMSYILMSSIHKWSWSVNTEIFFNLSTAAALYFLVSPKRNFNDFFLGLFMGLGFIVKYVVIFDLAAFVLFIWISSHIFSSKKLFLKGLGRSIIIASGFLLPFAIFLGYYYYIGHWNELTNALFIASVKYHSEFNGLKLILYFLEFHLVFAPMVLFFYYFLIKRNGTFDDKKILAILWFIFCLIAVTITGKRFHHYYIQLLLPLSFFWLDSFIYSEKLKTVIKNIPLFAKIQVAVALILIGLGMQYTLLYKLPDQPKEIANFIKPIISKEDVIYVDYKNVIYYLLDKTPPTPYVHSTLITNPEHIRALSINVDNEYRSILAKNPRYFVIQGTPVDIISNHLEKNCRLIKAFNGDVKIYERNDTIPRLQI